MFDAFFAFIEDTIRKPWPLVFGCVVGAAALGIMSSCRDDALPSPAHVFPNFKRNLDGLRNAKAFYENAASSASGSRESLAVGKSAYNAAREAHRTAIQEMRDRLMQLDNSLSNSDINILLKTAEAAGKKFYDWRYRNAQTEDNETGSSQSFMPGPADVIGTAIDVQSMYEERDRELRAYYLNELKQCEWETWDDIRGR
jgi:hypothetical protein